MPVSDGRAGVMVMAVCAVVRASVEALVLSRRLPRHKASSGERRIWTFGKSRTVLTITQKTRSVASTDMHNTFIVSLRMGTSKIFEFYLYPFGRGHSVSEFWKLGWRWYY